MWVITARGARTTVRVVPEAVPLLGSARRDRPPADVRGRWIDPHDQPVREGAAWRIGISDADPQLDGALGTPDQLSGGETLSPSHVNSTGRVSPSERAGLLTSIMTPPSIGSLG